MGHNKEINFAFVARHFCARNSMRVFVKCCFALGFLMAFLSASVLITWLIDHFGAVENPRRLFFLVIIGMLNLIALCFIAGVALGNLKERYEAYKKRIIAEEFPEESAPMLRI